MPVVNGSSDTPSKSSSLSSSNSILLSISSFTKQLTSNGAPKLPTRAEGALLMEGKSKDDKLMLFRFRVMLMSRRFMMKRDIEIEMSLKAGHSSDMHCFKKEK